MADTRNDAEHVVSHEDDWAVNVEGVEQPKKVPFKINSMTKV